MAPAVLARRAWARSGPSGKARVLADLILSPQTGRKLSRSVTEYIQRLRAHRCLMSRRGLLLSPPPPPPSATKVGSPTCNLTHMEELLICHAWVTQIHHDRGLKEHAMPAFYFGDWAVNQTFLRSSLPEITLGKDSYNVAWSQRSYYIRILLCNISK